jgi:hypothetical protein
MMNSSLALEQARRLAGKISDEIGREKSQVANEAKDGEQGAAANPAAANDEFVVAAFETVLTRPPSPLELNACREFLTLQASQLSAPQQLELLDNTDNRLPASAEPLQRARENLVLVLFNHNDFVMVR